MEEEEAPEIPGAASDARLSRTSERKMEVTVERKFEFVEVSGPDGIKKRFAKGTSAGFAVERFNTLLATPSNPVVCIVASKEGEEPIEFGQDVELVLYDETWTLQTHQEALMSKHAYAQKESVVNAELMTHDNTWILFTWTPVQKEFIPLEDRHTRQTEAKTELSYEETSAMEEVYAWSPSSTAPRAVAAESVSKAMLKDTTKESADIDPQQIYGAKGWEELFPGGRLLPEGGKQECTPAYFVKVLLMFFFVFAFAGGLSFLLERMPERPAPS